MKTKKLRQALRVAQAYTYGMIPFLPRPEKKFVVFGQGRTGSTLLVDLLNAQGDIRCDREIFNIFHFTGRKIKYPHSYIAGRSKRFPAKVYGFKVKIYQLKYDHGIADPAGLLKHLIADGYRIIYLSRENVLQHAYSNVKRSLTGITHVRDSNARSGKMSVPVDILIAEIRDRLKFKREELQAIADLPYLPVVYERDLLDSKRHVETVNRVRRYIGLSDITDVHTNYQKITDKRLSDEISNFAEIMEALKKDAELSHLGGEGS